MEARTIVVWLACGLVLGLAASAAPAASDVLRAGAAKVEITPNLKEFPSTSLGGFGERQGKPAQGVHDALYAHAVVLESGGARVALVSTDLLVIPGGMKEAVVKKVADLGFSGDTVLLAATHTHSAPEGMDPGGDAWPTAFGKFNRGLLDWTVAQIAESIRRAVASLQPAEVGFAAARLEGLNRNRRQTGEERVDSTMTVMKVVGPGAKPIAVVVNFAAHPTIMGGSNFLISADWPGAMTQALEKRMGAGVAAFFNGAQGDQTHAGDFGSGWERVERYGTALAEKAWQLAQGAKTSGDVALRAHAITWDLPEQRLSPAFLATTGQEYGAMAEQAGKLLAALFPKQVRLQAVRVGDAVLMAVPGEEIAELGLAMRANASAAGAKDAMVIGLSNTYIGYILSPKQYELGGYEAGTSFYGPQLGDAIIAKMKEAVGAVFGGKP